MSNKEEEIDIITKRRLIAYLGSYKEVIKIIKTKIYTSDSKAEHWLDSGLEGYLCFVTCYETKSRYFILYSYTSFEKLFEMELYHDFKNYYTILSEYFHCFEYCNGFIGFRFQSAAAAKMFNVMISKFDDKLLEMLMKGGAFKKDKKELIKRNIVIFKKKFDTSNMKYDSNYIEDELLIIKPRYFELLGNISYDKEKNIFIIDDQETKEFLKGAGVRKNQMKNTNFALQVFKNMIEILENIEGINVNYNVKRTLSINKNKNINHSNSISVNHSNTTIENTTNNKNQNISIVANIPNIPKVPVSNGNSKIPNIPSIPNIPMIPNIPNIPKIPNIPTIVPKIESLQDSENNNDSEPHVDLKQKREQELLNVILKKADQSESQPPDSHSALKKAICTGVKLTQANLNQEQKKITLNDKNLLSASLSLALEKRRIDMGHDSDKEEESDSDWSD